MKPRNTLVATSVFHFFQDGFIYAIFILIPSITSEFDLSLSQAGMLKFCLSGVSSIFQIPVIFIAERVGEATSLIAGFGWLSAGFMVMASSPSFIFLIIAAYSWRSSLLILGLMGLLFAVIAGILRNKILPPDIKKKQSIKRSLHAESGFGILKSRHFLLFCLIGIIDCSTRMTVFTFIPFLSQQKGFAADKVGFIVTLVFFGGIFGKFFYGYLTDKLGGEKVVMVSEFLTALFYTIYLLSGAAGPVLYGLLGDAWGLDVIFISLSIAIFFTIPVIWLYIRSKVSVI